MTSKTNLRLLLENAAASIELYTDPHIDQTRAELDKLLEAGDLGKIGDDKIIGLVIGPDLVFIQTRYEVRCCSQSDFFQFPTSIIDSEDPIQAMHTWARGQKIEKARKAFEAASREWVKARDHLEEVLKQ